ncbi:unnamed protein product [Cylindrotheca closterium]|uniref:EamA domain-containing protein n=1 Tax=Cylindrotheca closterium TaxID=2856 RepID=A0AAD2CTC5_9STRA|nr:unnamed protein product [Cylindrotheca closterium]
MRAVSLSFLIISAASAFQSGSIPAARLETRPGRLLETRRYSTQEKSSVSTISPLATKLNESSPQNDFVESSQQTSSLNSDLPEWFEPLAWRGVILVLCALWASNFSATKVVMAQPGVDASLYTVARFGVAVAALLPGAVATLKKSKVDMETVKESIVCGSWVAFGYLGQTLGLLSTTASKSCVICSLNCVFVAVVAEVWRVSRSAVETKFEYSRLIPALIAVIGVAIIELKGAGGDPNIGDLLSFAQPIGFGMGYLQLEDIMAKNPSAGLPVSTIKLGVVFLASLFMYELTPLVNGASDFSLTIPDMSPILASPLAIEGILFTGLITTAAALWVESIAFAKVSATDASIILTTEPLFAALIGALALGETFGASDYVGASLIIGACAAAILMGSEEEH